MTQVRDGLNPELALGLLHKEAVLMQQSEDCTDVTEVLCHGTAVDENVIEKYEHEPPQERPQDVIHQCLEGCRRVAKTEGHDEEFVQPLMGPERRLLNVAGAHTDLVVPRTQI